MLGGNRQLAYNNAMPIQRIPRTPVVQPDDPAIKLIGLTQGKVAIVDAEDYDRLIDIGWLAIYKPKHKKFYVSGYIGNYKYIRLHNFLMNPPKGLVVDHINRDPLDNRKDNLRIVTHSENMKNIGPRADRGKTRPFLNGKPTQSSQGKIWRTGRPRYVDKTQG